MKQKVLFFMLFFSIFFINFSEVFARAWNSSSSSWWESWIWLIIVWILYAIYEIRRKKLIKKAKADLENALKEDSSWDIEKLKEATRNIFFKYQEAWQEKDLSSVENLMTKDYFKKADYLMKNELFWKKNILKNIKINNLTLMSVKDWFWKDWDMFAMEVNWEMIDYNIDENTWEFVWTTLGRNKNESFESFKYRAMNQSSSFKEYYIFIRYNEVWLLQNIKWQFSIIKDIIWLKEDELKKILEKEKNSDEVDHSELYKD